MSYTSRVRRLRKDFEAPFLDFVHPLLSLSALRRLDLTFPKSFHVACTAADLRTVAGAFPVFETLHLNIIQRKLGSSKKETLARGPGGPLAAIVYFARNYPRLRLLHLPAMEVTEGSLDMANDGEHPREPHDLRVLVIPKVLLPPGRVDLARKVPEVVKVAFPLAAYAFRPESTAVNGDWAVMKDALRCPECSRGPKLAFVYCTNTRGIPMF